MQRQGGGSIVNIGSVLGLKAALAFPVHPYAVAKAGVGDAHEDDRRALREGRHPLQLLTDPAVRKAMEGRVPLGRLGRPDEIAQAVLHLASDEAAWTTGAILTVDGGIMAQ